MKNILLVTLSLLLLSCSSDNPTWNADEDLKSANILNIKINQFENFNSDLRSTPISEAGIKSLFYVIATDDNRIYHKFLTEKQIAEGGIHDTLPNGNYRIALCASTSLPNTGITWDAPAMFEWVMGIEWHNQITSDMFEYVTNFTLHNETLNLDVTMERMVAKIEVIPTDATQMPDDVEKIVLLLGQTTDGAIENSFLNFVVYSFRTREAVYYGDYAFTSVLDMEDRYDYSNILSSKTYDKAELVKVTATNPIELYPPTPTDFSDKALFARIYYKNGRSKYKLLKRDLPLERNVKLKLKGNIFTPNTSIVNGVEVETEWDEVVIEGMD